MPQIHLGRHTATHDEPIVVFLIGMRLNRLWAIHKWWKPFWNTMANLRAVQERKSPKGYLSGEILIYWRGLAMIQYWDTFENLEAFSHDPENVHLSAWRHLAKQSKNDHTFGYWHETYQITPGNSECIYGNMPKFGLGKAGNHASITEKTESAGARIST